MCGSAHNADSIPRIIIAMTRKLRILCVDNGDDICSLIAVILKECEIVRVHTKWAALRKATIEKFDLYLLDYYLPDGTGLELCKLIREFDPVTPILFVTSSRAISIKRAESVGAQGVVEKLELVDELPVAISNVYA